MEQNENVEWLLARLSAHEEDTMGKVDDAADK